MHDACALLTPHGRRRVLGFNVDYDEEGGIPPDSPRLPQTCEQLARRELATDRFDRGGRDPGPGWVAGMRRVRFVVTKASGTHATVTATGGSGARLELVKTSAGWRIDDSNAIPSGH